MLNWRLMFFSLHQVTRQKHIGCQKEASFRTKNFAIGSRMEHRQEIINRAQWGTEKLAGVKAAEYRLTSNGDGNQGIFILYVPEELLLLWP